MKVRSIQCQSCGGRKVSPSATAYVYCDFCGRYIDFDFYRAITAKGNRLPGPEYERLLADFAPRLEVAKKAQDEVQYTQMQHALHVAHLNACPASYSPRIGDPKYRSALLDYMSRLATLTAFDSQLENFVQEMSRATAELEWHTDHDAAETIAPELNDIRAVIGATAAITKCESQSFWRLFGTVVQLNKHSYVGARDAGLLDIYPEHVDEASYPRPSYCLFAQAWLPYLSANDQHRLLSETGLLPFYREVDQATLSQRSCGCCGAKLRVAEGAHTVICEGCGYQIHVGQEIPCGNCGGTISMRKGHDSEHCPFCQAEVRLMP